MSKESWFVTANTSIAKVYRVGAHQSLELVSLLDHPASRLHNQDLVSDKPGRDFESMGHTRHSLEPHQSPKQHEGQVFAKTVAEYLLHALQKGAYEALYLALSPSLLGLLRQELSPAVSKLIRGEVDKDMTQIDPKEIAGKVPFLLYSHSAGKV